MQAEELLYNTCTTVAPARLSSDFCEIHTHTHTGDAHCELWVSRFHLTTQRDSPNCTRLALTTTSREIHLENANSWVSQTREDCGVEWDDPYWLLCLPCHTVSRRLEDKIKTCVVIWYNANKTELNWIERGGITVQQSSWSLKQSHTL